MKYPNYNLERELLNQGYQNIVGVDEVGRGAWAGPIIAVAAMINSKPQITRNKQIPNIKFQSSSARQAPNLSGIKDSKLLSEKAREKIFEQLSRQVIWSVGIVSHKEIDQRGMTWANQMVIKRAIKKLAIEPDYLLIDQVYGFKHQRPHQLIINGDRQVLSIAVASILAKVTRDRLMRKYHQKFPKFNFQRHKGYGTKLHQSCLQKYGICKIHRQSYKPIKKIMSKLSFLVQKP
jgi:ribonuclease HII